MTEILLLMKWFDAKAENFSVEVGGVRVEVELLDMRRVPVPLRAGGPRSAPRLPR
jgi:hypothetical protein